VVHGPSAGREGNPRTHSGRRPRQSRGRYNRWLSHGRARTTSCGRLEDVADLLVEEVVLAVDAVAVDGEQDGDAVPGPGGDLGGVSAGVQPQRQGGVTQVVGAAGDPAGGEFGPEGEGTGGVPGTAVDRFAERPAAGSPEQPASGAVP
jgi:hypothetical protein